MHSRAEGDGALVHEDASFSVCDADTPAAPVDRRVHAILSSWQMPGVADTTCELVGLLVRAATPHPRRRADVRLRRYDGLLRGEVSGSHLFPPGVPAGHATTRHPQKGEAGVYGALPALLAARCSRWGCESSASGCTVWFELPAPARASTSSSSERPAERPGERAVKPPAPRKEPAPHPRVRAATGAQPARTPRTGIL